MLQLLVILPFSWNQLSCFLATDPWLIVVSIMHLSSWFTKHNELFCFVGSQPCIWCVKWEILHRELQAQQGLLWLHFGTEWQMKLHSEREPWLLQLCGTAFFPAVRTRRKPEAFSWKDLGSGLGQVHISLAADGIIPVPQLSVSHMGVMSAFHDFVGGDILPNSQSCKGWVLR